MILIEKYVLNYAFINGSRNYIYDK
jgi:hypothetical protein